MNPDKPKPTAESIENTPDEDVICLINQIRKIPDYYPFIFFLVGMVVVWWVWKQWSEVWVYSLARNLSEKLGLEEALTLAELGQAGDIFGGINALFAAFAFMGVAFAAYYQRKTFLHQLQDSKDSAEAFAISSALQKIETEENRAALKEAQLASAEQNNNARIALQEAKLANEEQSNNARKDLFNSFFFRMLAKVDSTMKNIKLTPSSVFGQWQSSQLEEKYNDDSVLSEKMMEHIDSELNGVWYQIYYTDQVEQKYGPQPRNRRIGLAAKYHEKLYEPNRKMLAPFLRNFFHTFTIVKEQNISYSEQCKYSKIARASIDDQILILVMLNGLSKEGQNLKPIIERYGLLKHLSEEGNTKHARMIAEFFYHPTAFLGYGKRKECYGNIEEPL